MTSVSCLNHVLDYRSPLPPSSSITCSRTLSAIVCLHKYGCIVLLGHYYQYSTYTLDKIPRLWSCKHCCSAHAISHLVAAVGSTVNGRLTRPMIVNVHSIWMRVQDAVMSTTDNRKTVQETQEQGGAVGDQPKADRLSAVVEALMERRQREVQVTEDCAR